jgi:type II secretory pathway pseudopilin PulG
MRIFHTPRPRRSRTGLTVIEIMITLALVTTGLLAAAGSFSTSLSSVQAAQQQSEAGVFLATVLENLKAQPFAGLLAFNGDRLFDGTDEDQSRYVAELTVFQAGVGLVQIDVRVLDLDTDRELTRVATLRADR